MDKFIEKWDYRVDTNIFYKEAITREASRAKWRHYYKTKAVFDLREFHVALGGVPLVQPDRLDDPIQEPADLDVFLAIIQETF